MIMSTVCWTKKLLSHRPLRCVRQLMLSRKVNNSDNNDDSKNANYFKDVRPMEEYKEKIKHEDPFKRTMKILKNDMKLLGFKVKQFTGFADMKHEANFQHFPTHTDILIIGGGAIGSSIAYFLKQRTPQSLNVTVIERDTTYSECSTALSVGGLRQQFSLEENVSMSLFGAEFLSQVGTNLKVPGKTSPDVQFQPFGYLFLASEKGAEDLKKNSEMQCKLGARNILLSPEKLKEKFPWLNTDGVEVGCLGLENEGWFDPWSLLNSLKQKSISLGVEYVRGNVVGFEFRYQPDIISASESGRYEQLERVILELPNGDVQAIKFGTCIIAAGANSGEIARYAKIGEESGLLSVPLPIEPRKRYVYCYHCPEGPGLNTPLVIDPEGAYFRREGLGGNFIGGMSPTTDEEPATDNLDVDYEFFDKKVWPILARRVPCFEKLKVKGGWAGYYEYNTMDENGVIGAHPYYHNLMIASGFSGHGIQHAPAVGRAMMELILDGEFKTINLSRFSFDRLCIGEPIHEVNIV